MRSDHARTGLQVRIKKDISRTVAALQGTPEMHSMAGNRKTYKIDSLTKHSIHGRILNINEYSWLPVDIIDMSEGVTDPVSLSGDKVVFDPTEI